MCIDEEEAGGGAVFAREEIVSVGRMSLAKVLWRGTCGPAGGIGRVASLSAAGGSIGME